MECHQYLGAGEMRRMDEMVLGTQENKDNSELELEMGTLAFTGPKGGISSGSICRIKTRLSWRQKWAHQHLQALKEAFLMEAIKEKSERKSQESAITGERTSFQKVGVMDKLNGSVI